MSGLEYPKIYTLYERKANRKVNIEKLTRPEFALIKEWQVTEKLNGRNVRVMLTANDVTALTEYGMVTFAGRYDEKNLSDQLDIKMIKYLHAVFTPEKMKEVFWRVDKLGIYQTPEVCLYLEGLGSCMAAGSGIYCKGKDVSVRLIDCYIKPWWLERSSLMDIASKFGIKCVPILGTTDYLPESLDDLEFPSRTSVVANEESQQIAEAEGIVARTVPLLFNRKGERVMWKLKFKDFEI